MPDSVDSAITITAGRSATSKRTSSISTAV
uniref:Uncharacterized protein n=1 Tax=Macrostomum lignano TaxID=282301 RepID=A0A1I8FBN0_9PLAT